MIKKLGGTRAILAYMLTLGFLAGCFTHMDAVKFTALATMATTGITYYFSNKATKDKPIE